MISACILRNREATRFYICALILRSVFDRFTGQCFICCKCQTTYKHHSHPPSGMNLPCNRIYHYNEGSKHLVLLAKAICIYRPELDIRLKEHLLPQMQPAGESNTHHEPRQMFGPLPMVIKPVTSLLLWQIID